MALAPHNGTATSAAAARMVNISYQETLILCALAFGPKTQDELVEPTEMLRSALAGRCNGLERKGLIRKTGETRLTRYGRPAAVYEVLTDKGQQAAQAIEGRS